MDLTEIVHTLTQLQVDHALEDYAALVILQSALAPIAKAVTLVLKSHGYKVDAIEVAGIGPDIEIVQ